MNQSLSTFLKIAVTVLSITAFLFVFGYNMVSSEVSEYQGKITGVQTPSASKAYSSN
ncbi:hypothetical protein [Caldifermentibacillus hisashii]|uniref:hypothetical protein n=1 Tax=Caldifermentibacillus hisashii TaxID=996558 RepID=UPI0022B9765C|nr:hypothetical protein [Caldifermentibacillus hisashii]